MQVANCHVRLGGDMTNEVFKPLVTPAEVIVLRAIHGDDAVVKLQPLRNDKREHASELQRLRDAYNSKVVDEKFPGAFPRLPVDFKDIGIDVYADFNKAPRAARQARASEGDATAAEGAAAEEAGTED